jgi:hypothetical protein
MASTFTPPRPDQWQGPADKSGAFIPPPVDSWQGPSGAADAPTVPGMEKLGGVPPGPPKPPLPTELDKNAPLTRQPGESRYQAQLRVTRAMSGKLDDLRESDMQPFRQIKQGVSGVVNAPDWQGRAAGASQAIRGAMGVAAKALPAVAPLNPIGTAAGLAAGAVGSYATEKGLKYAGVPDGYAELAGDVAGLVAGSVGAKAGTRAGQKWANARQDQISSEPFDAITRAVKPASSNVGWKDSLQRSMPEMKAAEADLGRPIQGVADALEAVKTAKQKLWDQRAQMMGRRSGAYADAAPVADAIVSSVPETLKLENPRAVTQILNTAAAYRKPMPLTQIEALLKDANAELDGFYAKYPGAKRSALRANPEIAASEAKARALREVLYNALDDEGQGGAPREIGQRLRALISMEDELYRRQNVADRQQPDSLSQQVGKWTAAGHVARGLVTGNPADVAVGAAEAAASKWVKSQQTTDALIARAFKNYNGKPAAINLSDVRQPAGFLTEGDRITPPPPDPSFVRSAPAMAQPPNPRRALPSPAIAPPPPPDGSFVRGADAMPAPPNPARSLPQGNTLITPPPPDPSYVKAVDAASMVARDPKSGRGFRVYSGGGRGQIPPPQRPPQIIDVTGSPAGQMPKNGHPYAEGGRAMYQGKPVRVVKIYPDGSADVEPIE